jgi:alpha-amylase/alpha-mannosidase (GH57 family)
LLCDSNIADISHPYIALPEQFGYPGDATAQMTKAKQYVENAVGFGVQGLWPPEGGISDEVLAKAVEAGFSWTASGQGVLERTLGHALSTEDKHRPHVWQRDQQRITVLFRDRRLSELIGVVYARMGAEEAANHFVNELHIVSEGKDAVIPVILDGENAWEHYAENGRPFLRALYRRISADSAIEAVTVSQALQGTATGSLNHVYPGSWLDGNFDIWIGAEENNRAWDLLLQARRKFDEAVGATVEDRRLAWEELMIAEGSDWFWWYDPEHSAESRGEFDALFREHLTNVYRLLGEKIPAELAHTLLNPQAPEHRAPAGMIQPVIDGRDTTQTEWANAGRYRPHHTSGPMHSQRPPIQELRYGSDGQNLYLWIGCGDATSLTVTLRNGAGERFTIDAATGGNQPPPSDATLPAGAVEAVLKDACEMRVSLAALHTKLGSPLFVKIDVRSDELPMGSLPAFGELELKQTIMAAYTF